MLTRLTAATALAAAAFAPAQLAAQADRTSPVPSYHLVQLSVDSSEVAADDFGMQTQAVRSCGDAMDLARAIGANVTRNRFVRATQLPGELRAIIEDLPAGHATPVFSGDGETLRVLVLCNIA